MSVSDRASVSLVLTLFGAVAAAIAQPARPQPDGGPVQPLPATVLASWPPGTFLESVIVAPDGVAYVINHGSHSIERVQAGEISTFAHLPGEVAGLFGLPDGGFLVTGQVEGGGGRVYRVDAAGGVTRAADLPEAGFLNGMGRLDETSILIADSSAGVLWRLDLGTFAVSAWSRDPLLGSLDPAVRFPGQTAFPAANGVKRRGDHVYVSHSERGAILRIPVTAEGAAGPAEVWADRLVADDFAFDAAGALYAPTHPFQSVVRIGPDGARTTIATPDQGLAGPTAVTFGPDGALLVVGNSLIPIGGAQRPATLVRLEVAGSPAPSAVPGQISAPDLMLVTAPTRPGGEAARQEHGAAYLRFLEAAYPRIALGGQVRDAEGTVTSRLYLVRAATPEAARALMEASPYFQHGVYGPLTVARFQPMLGGLIGGVAWPPPGRVPAATP